MLCIIMNNNYNTYIFHKSNVYNNVLIRNINIHMKQLVVQMI